MVRDAESQNEPSQSSGISVSLDGFGAGPGQDRDNPIGVRGLELMAWIQKTAVFRKRFWDRRILRHIRLTGSDS